MRQGTPAGTFRVRISVEQRRAIRVASVPPAGNMYLLQGWDGSFHGVVVVAVLGRVSFPLWIGKDRV